MNHIFIDTNALIQFLTDQNSSMKTIIGDRNNRLHVNTVVLNELKFKYMWILTSKKLGADKKYEIMKYLKTNTHFMQQAYERYLEFFLSLKERVDIHSVSEEDEIPSCELAIKHSLLPSDASILATMKKNNINKILTSDPDFEKIGWVEVIKL